MTPLSFVTEAIDLGALAGIGQSYLLGAPVSHRRCRSTGGGLGLREIKAIFARYAVDPKGHSRVLNWI